MKYLGVVVAILSILWGCLGLIYTERISLFLTRLYRGVVEQRPADTKVASYMFIFSGICIIGIAVALY